MQLPPFGAFKPLCRGVPSYPWCNLFFRQLANKAPEVLVGLSADYHTAPVGINPQCGIPRAVSSSPGTTHLGNIANALACALCLLFSMYLVFHANRRSAAVGRVEIRFFLFLYALTLPLQIITTGSYIEQSATSIVVLTAIHAGVVVALFWTFLGNAIVATQVVEDGTMASLVPFYALSLILFVATTYISLDTALSISTAFTPSSNPSNLQNTTLFVLLNVWPAAAAFFGFAILMYVVVRVLRERKPMFFYLAAVFLFVLSQLAYFLLSKPLCRASDSKVDGSFIATLLETAAVGCYYLAWVNITEDTWDDDQYYRGS
ncbi:hypothetical protein BOTBODRAFT_107135 [Botryobasidium botryosum FD-172 SS1]|uniref:Uncharacterized protein n=1 Tax=Botryobasidium botryosum (strain FD-172 SS1) TaxID=930990 RepID=A0A067MNV2_BOTB1|nr:hypothetical protein BOTBODRAFT_107135 [Botryobasidium botryosum FD-172 SS1]